jgi:hypothetical protein
MSTTINNRYASIEKRNETFANYNGSSVKPIIMKTPSQDVVYDSTQDASEFNTYMNSVQTTTTSNTSNTNSDTSDIMYLPDNPLASQIETSAGSQVQILICHINQDCTLPFLQFAVESDTKKLPKITAPATSMHASTTEIHTVIMNECINKLFELFPSLDEYYGEPIHKKMYRGAIQEPNTGNNYVVFEIDKKYKLRSKNLLWKIVDEIVYQETNMPNDFTIDESVKELFRQHPYLQELYMKETKLSFPALMYMCKKDKDIFEPVSESMNLIEFPSDHAWFGSYYYFSTKPLDAYSSFATSRIIPSEYGSVATSLIRSNGISHAKYAVFTLYDKYILRDISKLSEEHKEAFMKKYEHLDVISIYFQEGGIPFWCIKNPNNFTKLL